MFANKNQSVLIGVLSLGMICSAEAQEKLSDKTKEESPIRKRLNDPNPQVRLQAAFEVGLDEETIPVLIDLLAELPAPERKKAELALQEIAEEWSPNPSLVGDDEVSRRILRDAWAGWWRNVDGPALLAAFHKRTLSPKQMTHALARIAELRHEKYVIRERATVDLIAMGLPVAPLLRQAMLEGSLEQSRRMEHCLKEIVRLHAGDALPPVAARLLALRRPPGAIETLLAFAPFTEDDVMKAEVAQALHRLAEGFPSASLVKALLDPSPVRRTLAGEVLASASDPKVRAAVGKLLGDPDLGVRLRVAIALACAADREAVPVLIDLLAEVPSEQAWQAEEVLHTLAGEKAPTTTLGNDVAARQKRRDAWKGWYAAQGEKLKLVPQPLPPPFLGLTTIAAFSSPPDRTKSRIIEVDRHGKVRWQFTCTYPVDVRVLPNRRVLVSEGEAMRVTERDFKGNIHWQVDTPVMPYNVQRLPNGNTFVAGCTRLLEYDPSGKVVFKKDVEEIRAAAKLSDGQIVYLSSAGGQCIRLDAAGKPVQRFESSHQGESGCVLDLTCRGNLLITQGNKSMTEEFDLHGTSLWRTKGTVTPGICTGVRNGHLMVAVFSQNAVIELDRAGRTVWRHETPEFNPFLARKR